MLDRIVEIEAMRVASERQILEMEEAQRKILNDLNQEKLFYENERKFKAACLIQVFEFFAVKSIENKLHCNW